MKKFMVKKEPWPRFFVKLVITLAVICAAGVTFADRYQVGIDKQLSKCIPGYSFYLIDKKNRQLVRGGVYAFSSRGLQPFYPDGTKMVKYLRGLPGDHVEIRSQGTVHINNELEGQGFPYAEKLQQKMEDFVGETILKHDHYWFMGISSRSFDSRYWGTVQHDQIIGRAYPLF